MKLTKSEALYCKVLDTQGNLSIDDIKDCGFSEGIAVEALLRLSAVPKRSIVRNAVQALRRTGIKTYMGRELESYIPD